MKFRGATRLSSLPHPRGPVAYSTPVRRAMRDPPGPVPGPAQLRPQLVPSPRLQYSRSTQQNTTLTAQRLSCRRCPEQLGWLTPVTRTWGVLRLVRARGGRRAQRQPSGKAAPRGLRGAEARRAGDAPVSREKDEQALARRQLRRQSQRVSSVARAASTRPAPPK